MYSLAPKKKPKPPPNSKEGKTSDVSTSHTSTSTQPDNSEKKNTAIVIFNGNGYARADYPDGAVYAGEFQNHRWHGAGTFFFSDNAPFVSYEGQFQLGLRHGYGTLLYKGREADARRYEGYWSDDAQHGQGVECWGYDEAQDQWLNMYEGMYVQGVREGKGRYTWMSGDIYEGNWHNDAMHGPGHLYISDGSIFDGFFDNDRKHGIATVTNASGHQYQEQWRNGKRLSRRRLGKQNTVSSSSTTNNNNKKKQPPLPTTSSRNKMRSTFRKVRLVGKVSGQRQATGVTKGGVVYRLSDVEEV